MTSEALDEELGRIGYFTSQFIGSLQLWNWQQALLEGTTDFLINSLEEHQFHALSFHSVPKSTLVELHKVSAYFANAVQPSLVDHTTTALQRKRIFSCTTSKGFFQHAFSVFNTIYKSKHWESRLRTKKRAFCLMSEIFSISRSAHRLLHLWYWSRVSQKSTLRLVHRTIKSRWSNSPSWVLGLILRLEPPTNANHYKGWE